MSGFVFALLLALGIHLFHSDEEWWPMGRKICGALLMIGVIAGTVIGAEYYSASGETIRAILVGGS
jgi:hypothetical protein